jgi:hypothetical protein
MNKLTVFLHVPKCAGRTFQDVLENNYAKGRIWRYPRGSEPPCGWDHMQCVHGHFPIEKWQVYNKQTKEYEWKGIDIDFPNREKVYFTLLRDPIERVWSYYHHTDGHRIYGSIQKWMEDPKREVSEYYRRRANSHIWTLTAHEEITRDSLELAKENLKRTTFGIKEYFNVSLEYFKELHPDIFKTLEHTDYNVRKDKRDMTSDERAYIQSHVELDMELYQYARDQFIIKSMED